MNLVPCPCMRIYVQPNRMDYNLLHPVPYPERLILIPPFVLVRHKSENHDVTPPQSHYCAICANILNEMSHTTGQMHATVAYLARPILQMLPDAISFHLQPCS